MATHTGALAHNVIVSLKTKPKLISAELTQILDSLQSLELDIRSIFCKALKQQAVNRLALVRRS